MAEHTTHTHYEAEILRGLAPFAEKELQRIPNLRITAVASESISFDYAGSPRQLDALRTVVAIYRVEDFAVPRPKALLGHQHWQRLVAAIAQVRKHYTFEGFRLSAAGKDSSILTRIRHELSSATKLADQPEGELFLRLRRSKQTKREKQSQQSEQGWQILIRLTPRPLSARSWRVCNMAGGLNATLAASMMRYANVRNDDVVFNPMCGSGTLLIEARQQGFAGTLHGCDKAASAVECSHANIQAAGYDDIQVLEGDVTQADALRQAFDISPTCLYSCIVADVPWGDAIGNTDDNLKLYRAFLASMAQLSRPKARLLVLTHDMKKFEHVLAEQQQWQKKTVINKIYHGGHHPSLYVLVST